MAGREGMTVINLLKDLEWRTYHKAITVGKGLFRRVG